MHEYGKAAIAAVKLIGADAPKSAWNKATIDTFGANTSGQIKSCPRCAFLALCETGRIQGVSAGVYTSSKKNKEYALSALKILEESKNIASMEPNILWEKVMNGVKIEHNHQMDVVLALWNDGCVNRL